MEQVDSPTDLESGLMLLSARIDELSQTISRAKGSERLEDKDKFEKLERRHKALDDELRRLYPEGPDFRQGAKTEIEAGTDELAQWVDEFLTQIDSGYRPDRRPKPQHT
jgi:hypothetical protein